MLKQKHWKIKQNFESTTVIYVEGNCGNPAVPEMPEVSTIA